MAEAERVEATDRRSRQRFIARQRGAYCFWVIVGEQRYPLVDLSLEGFAMPVSAPSQGGELFEFSLRRANVPDEIRGYARVANSIPRDGGVQTGCLFEELFEEGEHDLRDWLIAHVIATATVPITEKDAARIVSGPSLI